MCDKRRFVGKAEALRANRSASCRLRAYWCPTCRAYHVTNPEKRTAVDRLWRKAR